MKPRIPLRQALADDNLLGRALPGPSWSTSRTLVIAAFGEELTAGRHREPGKFVAQLVAA